jgi:predicted nuclease of predicted toxin-antitoxin system
LKLLLDEMWSPVIAQQLRRRGFDVRALVEDRAMKGLEDEEVFSFAQREGWTIVTENGPDFMRFAREALLRGDGHHGLLLTDNKSFPRHHARIVGRMVRALEAVLKADPSMVNIERWLSDLGQG